MNSADQVDRGHQAAQLAHGAAQWLSDVGNVDLAEPSLYRGLAGTALALHEAHQHFDEPQLGAAVAVAATQLGEHVAVMEDSSLYFGLAGAAVALRSLGSHDAADLALAKIGERVVGDRWNDMFELLVGNAGIGLGALMAGDPELAIRAVTPYLAAADRTAAGVNWKVRPTPARSHHVAHGTLGIVYALAKVGHQVGREDLIELALLGAADVISRNEAGPDGFLVPHSDPPHLPDLIERYSYGWCNGPAGDAQVFRLLGHITGDLRWTGLQDACWHTIRGSGLPNRVRPGFWDNNGRCCGTAGVLAYACDRIVERGDDFSFADQLIDDLTRRAITDDSGARWANVEHRATPADARPDPGWAMGNAGIIRELLRYARLSMGGDSGYATPWPDHPTTLTADLGKPPARRGGAQPESHPTWDRTFIAPRRGRVRRPGSAQ